MMSYKDYETLTGKKLEPILQTDLKDYFTHQYEHSQSKGICFAIHPEEDVRLMLGSMEKPYEDIVLTKEDRLCCACTHNNGSLGRFCYATVYERGNPRPYCEQRSAFQNYLDKKKKEKEHPKS